MTLSHESALEVLPRDLSAYRAGNTGIDYVHRFDSGRPGPHVLVNALTHGNEVCGMVAATHLLDTGVRPLTGTLTVSFANVEAYESFDDDRPFDSRQIVHNLNRVWSAEWLDGDEDSPELRRARGCGRWWPPPITSWTSIPLRSRCSRSGSTPRSSATRPPRWRSGVPRAPGHAQRPGQRHAGDPAWPPWPGQRQRCRAGGRMRPALPARDRRRWPSA